MQESPKHFIPILKAALDDLNFADMSRETLFGFLAEIVDQQVVEERSRCVRLCRDRAETWRRTALAGSAIASAREEARSRANEAAYLADLLETP